MKCILKLHIFHGSLHLNDVTGPFAGLFAADDCTKERYISDYISYTLYIPQRQRHRHAVVGDVDMEEAKRKKSLALASGLFLYHTTYNKP